MFTISNAFTHTKARLKPNYDNWIFDIILSHYTHCFQVEESDEAEKTPNSKQELPLKIYLGIQCSAGSNRGLTHKAFCIFVTESSDARY